MLRSPFTFISIIVSVVFGISSEVCEILLPTIYSKKDEDEFCYL